MNKQQKSTTQRPPSRAIHRSHSTGSLPVAADAKPTAKSQVTKLPASHTDPIQNNSVSTSRIDKREPNLSTTSNISPRPYIHEDFELPVEPTDYELYQHQPNQHSPGNEPMYNDELSEYIHHEMISQQYSPIHEQTTMASEPSHNEFGKDPPSRNLTSEDASRADERRNAAHRNDQMYNNIVNITGSLEYDEYDIERISTAIDNHTSNMKKSVMDDLLTMKRTLYQKHNDILNQQKHMVRSDLRQAQSEIVQLKTNQQHLDKELTKQTTTIEKMIRSRAVHLHLLHYKPLMYEIFIRWKEYAKNSKRLKHLAKESKKLHQKHLMKKIFQAWHKVARVEKRKAVDLYWKDKLEKVSANIINKYEAELAKLREELGQAHSEINTYQEERERYQQEMKKAFMRGVCALNLEAMSMFKKPQGAPVGVGGVGDIHDTSTVAAMQQSQGSYPSYAPPFPTASSFRPPPSAQPASVMMPRPDSTQTPSVKASIVRHPSEVPAASAQKSRVTFSVPPSNATSKKPPVGRP